MYVKEHEWLQVASWVYDNFDMVSGVAFLPHSGHSGLQAPYQECTEEDYEVLLKDMPMDIDWTELAEYEKVDTTEGMKEFACTGTSCEFTGA